MCLDHKSKGKNYTQKTLFIISVWRNVKFQTTFNQPLPIYILQNAKHFFIIISIIFLLMVNLHVISQFWLGKYFARFCFCSFKKTKWKKRALNLQRKVTKCSSSERSILIMLIYNINRTNAGKNTRAGFEPTIPQSHGRCSNH